MLEGLDASILSTPSKPVPLDSSEEETETSTDLVIVEES